VTSTVQLAPRVTCRLVVLADAADADAAAAAVARIDGHPGVSGERQGDLTSP
jgi:hypothetical protein